MLRPDTGLDDVTYAYMTNDSKGHNAVIFLTHGDKTSIRLRVIFYFPQGFGSALI